MDELLRKLQKLSAPKKVGVTIAVIGLLGLLFYQLLYSDLDTNITSAEGHRASLDEERTGYQRRRGEYLAYRDELKRLEEEQREVLRALPRRAEIPTFLSNVQEQAELAGLEVLSVDIGQEVPQDLYLKIPVKMEVRGTYHQVARFFRNVGEMRRIVNVENLTINPDHDKQSLVDVGSAAPPKLRAKFVAAAFRYNEKTGGGGT